MLTIRRMLTDEFEQELYDLQAKCFQNYYIYPLSTACWWLAFEDEVPVGFAGFCRGKSTGAAYLCYAGVAESHRGRGLQKRLIRVRVREARRQGYREAVTDTYNNPASANSLIACGFRSFIPPVPWDGPTSQYWRLLLR